MHVSATATSNVSIVSTRGPNSVNMDVATLRSVRALLSNLSVRGVPFVVCTNASSLHVLTLMTTALGTGKGSIDGIGNIVKTGPVTRLVGEKGLGRPLRRLCSRVTRSVH